MPNDFDRKSAGEHLRLADINQLIDDANRQIVGVGYNDTSSGVAQRRVPADTSTRFRVHNPTESVIPPFSVFCLSGPKKDWDGSPCFSVRKLAPDQPYSGLVVYTNGADEIGLTKDDKVGWGWATPIVASQYVVVKVDQTMDDDAPEPMPEPGDSCGPSMEGWGISKSGAGMMCLGVVDQGKRLVAVCAATGVCLAGLADEEIPGSWVQGEDNPIFRCKKGKVKVYVRSGLDQYKRVKLEAAKSPLNAGTKWLVPAFNIGQRAIRKGEPVQIVATVGVGMVAIQSGGKMMAKVEGTDDERESGRYSWVEYGPSGDNQWGPTGRRGNWDDETGYLEDLAGSKEVLEGAWVEVWTNGDNYLCNYTGEIITVYLDGTEKYKDGRGYFWRPKSPYNDEEYQVSLHVRGLPIPGTNEWWQPVGAIICGYTQRGEPGWFPISMLCFH